MIFQMAATRAKYIVATIGLMGATAGAWSQLAPWAADPPRAEEESVPVSIRLVLTIGSGGVVGDPGTSTLPSPSQAVAVTTAMTLADARIDSETDATAVPT